MLADTAVVKTTEGSRMSSWYQCARVGRYVDGLLEVKSNNLERKGGLQKYKSMAVVKQSGLLCKTQHCKQKFEATQLGGNNRSSGRVLPEHKHKEKVIEAGKVCLLMGCTRTALPNAVLG